MSHHVRSSFITADYLVRAINDGRHAIAIAHYKLVYYPWVVRVIIEELIVFNYWNHPKKKKKNTRKANYV